MKFLSPRFLLMTTLVLGTVSATSLPEYDSGLLVYFQTTRGKEVFIKGPRIDHGDASPEYEWGLVSSRVSPNGEYLEAHYLGTAPKYWDAVVYLARPDGKVSILKNSKVKETQWTEDSQYLLGFGDNAIRVWNTAGGHRQINLENFGKYIYKNNLLCVEVGSYGIDQKTKNDGRRVEIYSIPTLKKLTSFTYLGIAGCNK